MSGTVQFFQPGRDLFQGLGRKQAGDGRGQAGKNLTVSYRRQPALHLLDSFDSRIYVVIINADGDDIMRIMGYGRGQSPFLKTEARHQSPSDTAGSFMPFHHHGFQDVT